MKIYQNLAVNDSNTSTQYARQYAAYTRDEILDWANLKCLRVCEKLDDRVICVRTGIQCDKRIQKYLTFVFYNYSDKEYILSKIDTRDCWYQDHNNGWIFSYYTWGDACTFFRDMALSLDDLYSKYEKKFENTIAEYDKYIKDKIEQQKIYDIDTDEFEGELLFMAEKYGYKFESEFASNVPTKKNYHFTHPTTGASIDYYVKQVKKYNYVCWEVSASTPWTKDYYSVYVDSFEAIKRISEGYMMMFAQPFIETDWRNLPTFKEK